MIMAEPTLFGVPVTLVFLYFLFYAFLGWAMETVYCSVEEKQFAVRGFLLGPICPIYGVGALVMVFAFSRFAGNLLVFYVVATVVMSAWEYFVGWALEVTTHMKYWDYSKRRFNLNGRISLFTGLWWGVLAYLAVFHIHPVVEELFQAIPAWLRYTLAGSGATLLAVDAATTIRKLALTAKVLDRLEKVSGELRLQASLGKAELEERLETAVDTLSPELLMRFEAARTSASKNLDEVADRLRATRSELIEQAEHYSRRFRNRYHNITSKQFTVALPDVKAAGEGLKEALKKAKKAAKIAREIKR